MSEQKKPTPPPFPTEADRAARALAMAGRSPVILNGMDDSYRDRLAALVSDKGESVPAEFIDDEGGTYRVSHIEAVRLIVLDYHESKKASVDEDDAKETPKLETPNDQSPAVDPPAAADDTGSADPPPGE